MIPVSVLSGWKPEHDIVLFSGGFYFVFSPAFAFEKWIIHIAFFLLHILQKGYAFAFEKVKKNTFIAHYTLYTFLSFRRQRPLSILLKFCQAKNHLFSIFFHFRKNDILSFHFQSCFFVIANFRKNDIPVVYKSEV